MQFFDSSPSLFIVRFSNKVTSKLAGEDNTSVAKKIYMFLTKIDRGGKLYVPLLEGIKLLDVVGWLEFSILPKSCKSMSLSSKELLNVGERAVAPVAAGLGSLSISL